jgi:hypothetical protein
LIAMQNGSVDSTGLRQLSFKKTSRIQPTAGSPSWPDQSVKILLLSA